jgi:hypothetical protein
MPTRINSDTGASTEKLSLKKPAQAEPAASSSKPSVSRRILIIARLTQPMMMQFTGMPRYSARKPRKKAAGLPE